MKNIVALVAIVLSVSACQQNRSSQVSVDFYNIKGNSVEALDRQIRTKGPRLNSGEHAVAVARIRMLPDFRFARSNGECSIKTAKVNVDAKVTLPAWVGRANADKKLGAAWDNIHRYTRLHEAYHVAVAFKHAKAIETEVSNLPPQQDCFTLRRISYKIFYKRLAEHEAEQRAFDEAEQKRFARLAARRT